MNMKALYRAANRRLFEWVAAWIMLGEVITLWLSPRAIELSAFKAMTTIGLNAPFIMVFFLVIGVARMSALYLNGKWRRGAEVRIVCAIAGALVWWQFFSALLGDSVARGALSPGLPVYLGLIIGEIFSCVRTILDDRPT